ncbi:MAG: DUF58 domain-containing protein [Bacteroidales bacterium]
MIDNVLDIKQLQTYDNFELLAKQVVEGFLTGLHRSPYHGFSVEFAEHRIYNPGDSTKYIDWKLYARTEKLFVKKYEEETNLCCYIVIDSSPSMLYPVQDPLGSKLAFSLYCSAALIYLLRKQRDAVGLSFFSDTVEMMTSAKLSVVHANMLYASLAEALLRKHDKNVKKLSNTAKCLHSIAETIHRRSLVIIFSDMFENENTDELFSALQHLRYNKHEVLLFHTIDRKSEENFEFPNRPYKFIDMETGDFLKINPNFVRETYSKAIKEYFKEIKLRCSQYHIDFIEVNIHESFNKVLETYLVKRNKLY